MVRQKGCEGLIQLADRVRALQFFRQLKELEEREKSYFIRFQQVICILHNILSFRQVLVSSI